MNAYSSFIAFLFIAYAVNVLLEMRRIAHQHIHIGSEAREDVKHVTSGEPVQTEPGDSLDGHVHTVECTDIDHAEPSSALFICLILLLSASFHAKMWQIIER